MCWLTANPHIFFLPILSPCSAALLLVSISSISSFTFILLGYIPTASSIPYQSSLSLSMHRTRKPFSPVPQNKVYDKSSSSLLPGLSVFPDNHSVASAGATGSLFWFESLSSSVFFSPSSFASFLIFSDWFLSLAFAVFSGSCQIRLFVLPSLCWLYIVPSYAPSCTKIRQITFLLSAVFGNCHAFSVMPTVFPVPQVRPLLWHMRSKRFLRAYLSPLFFYISE